MLYFLQQLLNGLHAGALYALLAFGYVVINGVLHRTNLAYGGVFAFCGHAMILATLFGYDVLWLTWPAAIALGVAAAFFYAWVAGFILSRHVLETLAGRSPNSVVAATLAVAIVLMEMSRIAADTKDYWLPPFLSQPIVFASRPGFQVTLTVNQLSGCAVAIVILFLGAWTMNRSMFGRLARRFRRPRCGGDVRRRRGRRLSRLVIGQARSLPPWLASLRPSTMATSVSARGMIYGLRRSSSSPPPAATSSPSRAALGRRGLWHRRSTLGRLFRRRMARCLDVLAFLAAVLVLRAPARDDSIRVRHSSKHGSTC